MSASLIRPDTAPKKFAFVLMPFDGAFRDIYEVGIKPACRDAGAYCERVDEQIFHESILEQVFNQISKADLIVADMTGRNANVFYEVGYAHALNKKTILLTASADDIPFDLKHYPHIVYGGSITSLKEELERRVRWYMRQPPSTTHDDLNGLRIYIDHQHVQEGQKIALEDLHRDPHDPTRYSYTFTISINNPSGDSIIYPQIRISMLYEATGRVFMAGQQSIPGDGYVVIRDIAPEILPFGWEFVKVECRVIINVPEGESSFSQPVSFSITTPTRVITNKIELVFKVDRDASHPI